MHVERRGESGVGGDEGGGEGGGGEGAGGEGGSGGDGEGSKLAQVRTYRVKEVDEPV